LKSTHVLDELEEVGDCIIPYSFLVDSLLE
jgi:hypothetical protein